MIRIYQSANIFLELVGNALDNDAQTLFSPRDRHSCGLFFMLIFDHLKKVPFSAAEIGTFLHLLRLTALNDFRINDTYTLYT